MRKKYSIKTNRKIIETIKSQTQKGKQVNLPIYLETKSANGKSFTYTFSVFFFPVKSEERGGEIVLVSHYSLVWTGKQRKH